MKRIVTMLMFLALPVLADPTFDMMPISQLNLPKQGGGGGGTIYPVFENTPMTGYNTPPPVMITTSDDLGGTRPAYLSYSRVCQGSGWYNNDSSSWNKYDCGVGQSAAVSSMCILNYPGYNPKLVTLSWSDDDIDYTPVYSNTLPAQDVSLCFTDSTGLHRYWRVDILSVWNYQRNLQIELSSADFEGPIMTSDTDPSPYVISADSENGVGVEAYHVVNWSYYYGNVWYSQVQPYPHYLQVYYGSNVVINGFVYSTAYGYASTFGFKDYALEASTDGSTFDTIDTGTLASAYGVYSNNNTKAYSYWRLTGRSGYDPSQASVGRLNFKHYK